MMQDGQQDQSDLAPWIERQYHFSARAMLASVSATHLVRKRPGFHQSIRPMRGSVVASPVEASYDPDPDYFFHWLRDSALVIDAVRVLVADGTLGAEGLRIFEDFLHFSLKLCSLDGEGSLKSGDPEALVEEDVRVYARPGAELRAVRGDAVLAEARYNPDGTLDTIRWGRPQHDGPALRALTVMRFATLTAERPSCFAAPSRTLLDRDIDFLLRHWHEPCFDLWEECHGHHYHTRLVQQAALEQAAEVLDAAGDKEKAAACRAAAAQLLILLDAHFDADRGHYLAHSGQTGGHDLDIAVILAVIEAARREGSHSITDPRVLATLHRLEHLFAGLYRINRDNMPECGPAMGRYEGDSYFSGGPYYFASLGTAQFYYDFARAVGEGTRVPPGTLDRAMIADLTGRTGGGPEGACLDPAHYPSLAQALIRRGDSIMEIMRRYTPEECELAEQFDGNDGHQSSAKNLAWSHAAFITAAAARREALRCLTG